MARFNLALLDELAPLIRQQLKLDASSLPLAKILQGGTWQAGVNWHNKNEQAEFLLYKSSAMAPFFKE